MGKCRHNKWFIQIIMHFRSKRLSIIAARTVAIVDYFTYFCTNNFNSQTLWRISQNLVF